MEENIYQIRLTVERMHMLMEELVAQRKCLRCAAQAPPPPEPEEQLVMPPEDETFNRIGAARFLVSNEHKIDRYRLSVQPPYSHDTNARVCIPRPYLETLFIERKEKDRERKRE